MMEWTLASCCWQIIICLVVLFGTIYYIFRQRYTYWRKRGVYGPKPSFPYGNIRGDKHLGLHVKDLYDENKNRRFIGIFVLHNPVFMVNDLELVKNVYVNDFTHFSDHGMYTDDIQPLMKHLFNLTGSRWKALRSKLTPLFTAAKIRGMFDMVKKCTDEMSLYLNQTDHGEVELKEILNKVGCDVIASCAFGIECNSFENPNNKFRQMEAKIFHHQTLDRFRAIVGMLSPKLAKHLRWIVKGKEMQEFFYGVVDSIIKERESNGIVRNDFIQMMMNLRDKNNDAENSNDIQMTTMMIAAQSFEFFIAGFDTTSSVVAYAIYEMALHPEIQNTLRQEIDTVLKKYNGKISYEALAEMVYMSRVIEETLRLYPPLPVHFRKCTKDYIIPGTDITLKEGTRVMIPWYGIHRDPEIHENPDEFDPDRFIVENREAKHQFSNITFGEGPRSCIGKRFGVMQSKLSLTTILSRYEIFTCEKTIVPAKFVKKLATFIPDGGLWFKLKRRSADF